MKFPVAFLLALLGLCIPATAENFAKPNRSSQIFDVAVWMPYTCATFGPIKHRIKTPPKHGRLDFTSTMSKGNNIPASCKGKVRGLQVIYTPDRGYRGPDSFSLTVFMPRFENDPAPRGHPLNAKFTVK